MRVQLSMPIQYGWKILAKLSLIGCNLITLFVWINSLSRYLLIFMHCPLILRARAPTNRKSDGNSSATKLKLNQIWNKHKSSTEENNKIYELVWVKSRVERARQRERTLVHDCVSPTDAIFKSGEEGCRIIAEIYDDDSFHCALIVLAEWRKINYLNYGVFRRSSLWFSFCFAFDYNFDDFIICFKSFSSFLNYLSLETCVQSD